MAILKRFLISYNNDRWHQEYALKHINKYNSEEEECFKAIFVKFSHVYNGLNCQCKYIHCRAMIKTGSKWMKPASFKKRTSILLILFMLPPRVRVALGKIAVWSEALLLDQVYQNSQENYIFKKISAYCNIFNVDR